MSLQNFMSGNYGAGVMHNQGSGTFDISACLNSFKIVNVLFDVVM